MSHWLLWLFAGIVAVVGGLLAIFNPLSASVAAITLVGWSLLLFGGLQAYFAWQASSVRETISSGAISFCALFFGVVAFSGPLEDGSFIRIVLSLLLIVSGVAVLWRSRELRGDKSLAIALVAGAVPILLGVILAIRFPAFIADNLGVMLGCELLALGVALIVFSLRCKKKTKAA